MAELARNIISAYQAGSQERQQDERRKAVSAYLPGALRGSREDAGRLAADAPDIGLKMFEYLQGLDDRERKQAIENSEWLAPQLLDDNGETITDPKHYAHLRLLASASGRMPEDKIALITPENAPSMIQASQVARQYKRQIEQDALNRRQVEANIRQSDAAAAASGRRGAGGIPGGRVPSGYRYVIGADGVPSLEPIPGGPADKSNKPLPPRIEKGFQTLGDQAASARRSIGNFKDEYGSQGVAGFGGGVFTWLGRNLPIAPGASSQATVNWWQEYDRYKNQVRNELFGSALTPSEQAAFEKADINESMHKDTIRANLRTQERIVNGAIKRRTLSAERQGLNVDAINELTGGYEDVPEGDGWKIEEVP